MKIDENDTTGLEGALQVVDKDNKALLSVHRVCAQGHDVVFSETKGNLILQNGSTDDCIPLRTVGDTRSTFGSGLAQVEVRVWGG